MLKDQLDWDRIMVAGRFAGGHEDLMCSLFKDAQVIASYIEDDWQGTEAFTYQMPDGKIVIVTDYFGTCSGCDCYEDCSDDDLKQLCIQLANNAHVFNSIDEAIHFIEVTVPSDKAAYYAELSATPHLLDQLKLLKR